MMEKPATLNLTDNNDFQKEGIEDVIEEVVDMQKLWPEHVTELSRDEVLDLYKDGYLKVGRKSDGEVAATLYKKPIGTLEGESGKKEDIFRVGGLAAKKGTESAKVLVNIIGDLVEEVLINNQKLVAKTTNAVLGKYLEKLGMKKLIFEDAMSEYPDLMKIYLEDSPKDESEYYGKFFYFGNV